MNQTLAGIRNPALSKGPEYHTRMLTQVSDHKGVISFLGLCTNDVSNDPGSHFVYM